MDVINSDAKTMCNLCAGLGGYYPFSCKVGATTMQFVCHQVCRICTECINNCIE